MDVNIEIKNDYDNYVKYCKKNNIKPLHIIRGGQFKENYIDFYGHWYMLKRYYKKG